MIREFSGFSWILGFLAVASVGDGSAQSTTQERTGSPERVRIANDRKGFILERSGSPFRPRGFNYDHDERGRLLEDYWEIEWPKVVEDFREMKALGANVVRIHLQVGKFLKSPKESDAAALDRLGMLVSLAEETGLHLDLTGLGCYRKADVPAWYDELDEAGRWTAQATFWEAVAGRCAGSPAIFCYDLMNEPVVPGGRRKEGDWLGPPFGGYCYVQFITLDQGTRPRPEIARAWIDTLVDAIRRRDPAHLITVGMVDWSLDRPGLTSGFVPSAAASRLDFLSVHLYPKATKVDEAIETLREFARFDKPVVIEETFPLKCSIDEFRAFLDRSRPLASGWIGFYWGKTIEEYRPPRTIPEGIMLRWLELFQEGKS
jgi:hypothetical protein